MMGVRSEIANAVAATPTLALPHVKEWGRE